MREEHIQQEEELKAYYRRYFPDFNSSRYKLYGERWERVGQSRKKKLFAHEPDLVLESLEKDLIWVGEAKIQDNFTAEGRLTGPNHLQLESYCGWLSSSENIFKSHKIIYSVPSIVNLDAQHFFFHFFRKYYPEINYKVISYHDD